MAQIIGFGYKSNFTGEEAVFGNRREPGDGANAVGLLAFLF